MQMTYGFFGKLPSIGDFVSRGWSNVARDSLDRVVQEALTELLASSFAGKEAIANAPCLALKIRPGAVCESGFVIVVMPSEDRVGRRFPLCAGVQWSEDGPARSTGWPSMEYVRVLVACVQKCVDAAVDPDGLCAEIASLGSPQQFGTTFGGLGGDETVPRLAGDTKLLRVQGPLSAMSPSLVALCAALGDSSDVLGFSLGRTGDAQDFFVCRRIVSGSPLAAAFDGQWVERGWTSYGSIAEPEDKPLEPFPNFDDDATQPHPRTIDRLSPQPDSLDKL